MAEAEELVAARLIAEAMGNPNWWTIGAQILAALTAAGIAWLAAHYSAKIAARETVEGDKARRLSALSAGLVTEIAFVRDCIASGLQAAPDRMNIVAPFLRDRASLATIYTNSAPDLGLLSSGALTACVEFYLNLATIAPRREDTTAKAFAASDLRALRDSAEKAIDAIEGGG